MPADIAALVDLGIEMAKNPPRDKASVIEERLPENQGDY